MLRGHNSQMRLRKTFALWFLAGFTASAAGGQLQPLRAEIKLSQTVVKNNEDFSVTATIRNTGTHEEMLEVWTRSYPSQWRADSPAVKTNATDCLQNSAGMVPLSPGKTYTRQVSVHLAVKDSGGRQLVTFRLGYGTDPYFGTIEPAPKSPAIWSNAVTVSVVSE